MSVDEPASGIRYRASQPVSNELLNTLFGDSWPDHTWMDFQPILARSLLYLCAYDDELLVGFVNVAWDGGIHAFILDTTVIPSYRHKGIGVQLVQNATILAQEKGIHWLHVDFEPHLEAFYLRCGFQSTHAGLMRLNSPS